MTSKQAYGSCKIIVATLAYGELPYFHLSRRINEAYCQAHGYSFRIIREPDDKGRHPNWAKLSGVRKLLSQADYVFFLDADAYFADQEKSLESFITERMGDASFVGGTDRRDKYMAWSDFQLNTGSFLVKNDEVGHKLLATWWDAPMRYDRRWLWQWALEQSAFNYLVLHFFSEQAIKLIPYPDMNGRDGKFIRHLMGMTNEERIAILQRELTVICGQG